MPSIPDVGEVFWAYFGGREVLFRFVEESGGLWRGTMRPRCEDGPVEAIAVAPLNLSPREPYIAKLEAELAWMRTDLMRRDAEIAYLKANGLAKELEDLRGRFDRLRERIEAALEDHSSDYD